MIDRKRIAVTGGLSVAAGIHLAVAGAHDAVTTHGAFFAVAGLVQLTLAVMAARAMTRTVLVAAVTSSVVLLATWLAQRLGPDATDGPGLLDTIASAAELLVAVAATSLVLGGSTVRRHAVPRSATVALVAVAAALSFAAAPAEHDDHHVDERPPAAAVREARPHQQPRHATHDAVPPADLPAPVAPHTSSASHGH